MNVSTLPRTLSFVAIAVFCLMGAFTARADVYNALWNAYPNWYQPPTEGQSQYDNPSYFYTKWSAYYADGTEIPAENRPYACFSEVKNAGSENALYYYYNHSTSNLPNTVEIDGLPEGTVIMVLNYPGNTGLFEDCHYSIPITVPEAGEYTLSGCVAPAENNTHINSSNFFSYYNQMVFVAEKELGRNSFSIVTGPQIEAKDANGNPLPTTFTYLPEYSSTPLQKTEPFSKTINLTTDCKYLSLYARPVRALVGNLKLEKNIDGVITGVEGTLAEPQTAADADGWFDLSGRRVAAQDLSANGDMSTPRGLAPGIYLHRHNGRTAKHLVR